MREAARSLPSRRTFLSPFFVALVVSVSFGIVGVLFAAQPVSAFAVLLRSPRLPSASTLPVQRQQVASPQSPTLAIAETGTMAPFAIRCSADDNPLPTGTGGTRDRSVHDNSNRNRTRTTKLHLVIDFDGTCTQSDTTAILPKLASFHAKDCDETKKSRMENYTEHEKDYFEQYSQVKDAIMMNARRSAESDSGGSLSDSDPADVVAGTAAAAAATAATMTDAINHANSSSSASAFGTLDAALDALDDVSTQITRRVSQSRCLAGLPQARSDMKMLIDADDEFGEALRLRENCVRVVADAYLQGWNLGVLSINWCRSLIDAVLVHPVEAQVTAAIGSVHSSGGSNSFVPVDIWSNALDANGTITLEVPGAVSKRDCIVKLRRQGGYVVYVGDSSTDLLALLEADVGILIGGSSSASDMAKRWGIELVHVAQRPASGIQAPDTVWTASDWIDIEKVLAGCRSHVHAVDDRH